MEKKLEHFCEELRLLNEMADALMLTVKGITVDARALAGGLVGAPPAPPAAVPATDSQPDEQAED